MNEKTVFIYQNAIGKVVFAHDSPFWLTEIEGFSSVEIEISQSQSTMQIGSSIASQSVRPRSFTIDGVLFDPLSQNREHLLHIIAPQMPATLTVIDGSKSWFLDVVPEKTPEITPGNGAQLFQCALHAAYPYWRTTDSYKTQVAGLIAMFKFKFYTGGKWWISRYSRSFFHTLANDGNVPIEFEAIFRARSALSNPEIYHMATKKRILIRKPMIAGEQMIVSTIYGKKGVLCISNTGEVTNGFRYLSVDSDLSMTLIPGGNMLRIDAAQNRQGLDVHIKSPKGVKSGV